MNLKVFYLALLLLEVSCFTEFEITVPSSPVSGLFSEAVILPCSFPVDRSWDLSTTVITWQRGLDVVHSFYYSRDQLDRQNPLYVNRTSLFVQELQRGNASLRLDRVSLQDGGDYTCSISINSGSQKKSFRVNIAAFYSEPRLQISMVTDGVNLLVTSDGGFPSPTLQWLKEDSDITNQTQTHFIQDTQTGLYLVSSKVNLSRNSNSSLTFILHNEPSGQDIRREIRLCSDTSERPEKYRCQGCFVLFSVICLLMLTTVMALFVIITRRKRRESAEINGLTQTGLKSECENLNGNGHAVINDYADTKITSINYVVNKM